MANHSRDDMENQGNAETGLLFSLIGIVAMAVAGGVKSSNKKHKASDLNDELRSINIQL